MIKITTYRDEGRMIGGLNATIFQELYALVARLRVVLDNKKTQIIDHYPLA